MSSNSSSSKLSTDSDVNIISGESNSDISSNESNDEPATNKRDCNACDDEVVIDPHGPQHVTSHVLAILEKWSKVTAISPDTFLTKLLSTRGYDCTAIPPHCTKRKCAPSEKEISDYDNELVWAIRNSHLEKLKVLKYSGRSMKACNRFSESIIHMACRRSDFDIVEYVLQNGADISVVDDFGRTPLHDACWSMSTRFDVATLLLDQDPQLLLKVDVRGCSPLKYVREEHWLDWCAFLYYQKERYWPILPSGTKRKWEGCE